MMPIMAEKTPKKMLRTIPTAHISKAARAKFFLSSPLPPKAQISSRIKPTTGMQSNRRDQNHLLTDMDASLIFGQILTQIDRLWNTMLLLGRLFPNK